MSALGIITTSAKGKAHIGRCLRFYFRFWVRRIKTVLTSLEALAHSGYSEYVFRSPRFKDQPVDCKVLTRAWARARVQLGLDDVVLHDFRRTCATGLQKLGVRLEVTEAVLNHKSGSVSGIVAIYQRHDWKVEKREALEAWAAEIMRLDKSKVS